jgi:hypothetical protein
VGGFLSFLENKDPRMHSLITQQGRVVLEGDTLVVWMPRGSSYIEYLNDTERAQKLRDELTHYFKRPVAFSIETEDASTSRKAPPPDSEGGVKAAGDTNEQGAEDNRQKLINSDTARHIFEVFEDVDVKGYTPGKK